MLKKLVLSAVLGTALGAAGAYAGPVGPRDPYTDGGKATKFDVYTDGAAVTDRRNVFSDGARITNRDGYTDGA
ncbi:signal peptide protein [Ralstonia pickettii DTP0602]|nr:signal peptide protein [Ralstonia pickettii DTP0602]